MLKGQTVALKEQVSQQTHGIVLCWCAYENGKTQKYDNIYSFVPKSHIVNRSGQGVLTTMSTGGFGSIGAKYVYVYDQRIEGSDVNVQTGTNNGVTFDNRHWVLDTVVGV